MPEAKEKREILRPKKSKDLYAIISARLKDGYEPWEIAQELGVRPRLIHYRIERLRKAGAKIPDFRTIGKKKGLRSIAQKAGLKVKGS